MATENFQYQQLDQAEHDLVLFSRMNMNEDKPLYLLLNLGNTYNIIRDVAGINPPNIVAIGLNGIMFKSNNPNQFKD